MVFFFLLESKVFLDRYLEDFCLSFFVQDWDIQVISFLNCQEGWESRDRDCFVGCLIMSYCFGVLRIVI